MKKLLASALAGFTLISGVTAQSVSITNIFGGNTDNTASSDFLSFDKDFQKKDMSVGDRVQLDVASERIDSRVRFDFATSTIDGKNASTRLRGYANLKPVKYINIIGGNNFFSKFAVASAYLNATEDYTNHGKLCDDNGAGLVLDVVGLKLAASVAAESALNLNFGASYKIADAAELGVTAQDVTRDSRSFSAYAGLLCVENLSLNAGYTYDYNNTSYLGSTQHAIQFSAGYNIADIGLGLFADYEMGLNNVKGDGKGSTYENSGMPVYGALRISYKNEDLTANLKGTVKYLPVSSNSLTISAYPYVDYNTKLGTFRAGVRAGFTESGFNGISVPFSWTYKLSVL